MKDVKVLYRWKGAYRLTDAIALDLPTSTDPESYSLPDTAEIILVIAQSRGGNLYLNGHLHHDI